MKLNVTFGENTKQNVRFQDTKPFYTNTKDVVVLGGKENLDKVLTEQEALIEELKEVLDGKAAGGCDHTIETWIFTLEDGTTVEKAVVVDA